MPKRLGDTDIWKKQRWFRKLIPDHKLAFLYIKDQCDHAGIWNIDCTDLVEDLGIQLFDLDQFIVGCNTEYNKTTGKITLKERIRLLDKGYIWVTGFIQFQYKGKEGLVNPYAAPVKTALQILSGLGLLSDGLDKGYITLTEELPEGYLTPKDKDKSKGIKGDELVGSLEGKGGVGEREGKREEREGFIAVGIGPQMVQIFKNSFPEYPVDQMLDFGACLEIAYKIAGAKNLSKEQVVNGKQGDIVSEWKKMVDFIKSNKWYSTRSISEINKQFQGLIQSIKNGTSSNGTNQNQPVPGIVTERNTRGF